VLLCFLVEEVVDEGVVDFDEPPLPDEPLPDEFERARMTTGSSAVLLFVSSLVSLVSTVLICCVSSSFTVVAFPFEDEDESRLSIVTELLRAC